MTITIAEIWDGRQTELSDRDNSHANRVWHVKTDNKNIREQAILSYGISNGFFPNRYYPHPDNAYLTCRRLLAKQDSATPLHWFVTADYSSEPLKESDREKEENENPLDRPAKVKMTTNRYRKPVILAKNDVQYVDVNDAVVNSGYTGGKAIVMSVGEYPDPPPEKDASHWNIIITKNIAQLPAWFVNYDNPINSTSVTIENLTYPARTLKLQEVERSELQNEGLFQYYSLMMQMEYRKEGWRLRVLDQALRQKSGSDRENIKDKNGKIVTAPWPLNGFGFKIADPTPVNVVYLRADIYDELDFNTLPIT